MANVFLCCLSEYHSFFIKEIDKVQALLAKLVLVSKQ